MEFRIFNGVRPNRISRGFRYVGDDDFLVGEEEDVLMTTGVGPCLVITLYSPELRKGVLAHIGGFSFSPAHLSPRRVISTLLDALSVKDISRLQTTLSGESFSTNRKSTLVKSDLKRNFISLGGEDLGGKFYRQVWLDCNGGDVAVYYP